MERCVCETVSARGIDKIFNSDNIAISRIIPNLLGSNNFKNLALLTFVCQILELDSISRQKKIMETKVVSQQATFHFQRSIVNVSSGGNAMNTNQ